MDNLKTISTHTDETTNTLPVMRAEAKRPHKYGPKLATTLLAFTLVTAPSAWAGHKDRHITYAKVTNVKPVTETIVTRVPHEECWTERVRYEEPARDNRSYTGTILGGIIGGAVGHAVGHKKRNKQVGTAVGAVLGASIGHDLSNRHYTNNRSTTHYRDEQRCETYYEKEYTESVVGYDVWYRYHGEVYQTRMAEHPGKRIPVRVSVSPVR
ncbi:outer membrane lipoprotein [Oleiphilus messinensis]|uniref:Outer membrane lipoprotein n=1 Tax=Oleiphilus messinensis TaxID=141451 RepID=A0A1Y0IC38_9GAMM|nr:glycine zipper 2TM domain-containing protein [Oleiphilus messinensis]ARU58112.1 outer membrane lipoprotein [Oleiphilus messinensis]